ncbi:ArsR/SmtB family transcription factor [Pseudonocardia sp. HH130630-07]|uniref:ArsR/SmtB family transcription factor n=1 Tax=Pseudonocardia sp. HH130630-07 TaxID=1690815 RepID=UPI000839C079|nr:helix-turn-helix transcriptional regulator [Pseudonocardia sp. HH130630-07]
MPGSGSDIAATARVIGEPARAAMLLCLMDSRPHTARALAESAGVTPSTASTHLRHLVDAGLVTVTTDGRRRLHSIASPGVVAAIEALAVIAPAVAAGPPREDGVTGRLQAARVCHSHLGGALAVSVTRQLSRSGTTVERHDDGSATLRSLDHPLLASLGITTLTHLHGPALRMCPDWTEGAAHLAGRLGTAVLTAMLEQEWVQRRPADRALTVTDAGREHLTRLGVLPDTG